MTKHEKKIALDVNAATLKSLGRASKALSGLAGAWVMVTNESCTGARRRTAR